MIFEIDKEQEEKIKIWLNEIRVEDEYFPQLIYSFIPGDIGSIIIIENVLREKNWT